MNLDGYTISQIADGGAGEQAQRVLHSACGLCNICNITIDDGNPYFTYVICDMEFDTGSIEEVAWKFSKPIQDNTYQDILTAHKDALACERIMHKIKSIL